MKKYFSVFVMTAIVSTSAQALAGYDEFDCVTNTNLELTGLQCVACGITKYYKDKGVEGVNPSQKWLALLAVKARERGFSETSEIAKSSYNKEQLQKAVIRQVQRYGFCTNYVGKDTAGSRNSPDIKGDQWKTLYEFINRGSIPPESAYKKIASNFFGFKSPGVFSSGNAKTKMDFLFEGAYENISLDNKRALFREKIVDGRDFIESGDDDQGLRSCLGDIKQRFFPGRDASNQMSDRDTYNLCQTMAQACDIERVPMSADDFCVHKGMGLRPATTTQPNPIGGATGAPRPIGGSGTRPPPPPPGAK